MIAHVEKHLERFEAVLVKDKDVAPEDPAPYMSIKSWISEAAKPGTWIDGLALQAVAEKKGVPLIVFKRDAEAVRRFTVAPRFKNGMALVARRVSPVCLVLERAVSQPSAESQVLGSVGLSVHLWVRPVVRSPKPGPSSGSRAQSAANGGPRNKCQDTTPDSVIGPDELGDLDRLIASSSTSSVAPVSRVWTCPLCQVTRMSTHARCPTSEVRVCTPRLRLRSL